MTRFRLLIRNLLHFRLANLAVVAGMAVATAVLTGALLVGDSVRGSLRELAVRRLGPIDHAMYATRFFPEDLARRVAEAPEFAGRFETAVAGVLVRGGASNASGDARTAGVQIGALREGAWLTVPAGRAVINQELADVLGVVEPDETVLLNVPMADETPRDSALARRGREDVVATPRLQVESIVGEPGMVSLFSLGGGQRTPLNLWTNLTTLQNAIDQPKRGNLLFVQAKPNGADAGGAAALNAILKRVHVLDDYGLELTRSPVVAESVLSSRGTYLPAGVEGVAEEAARAAGTTMRKSLIYLANHVTKIEGGKRSRVAIHYAIAAGIDALDDVKIGADEVAVNQWTAEQLRASVGDHIVLDYYERRPNGDLVEVSSDRPELALTLRIAHVLPMQGLAIDPSLTPEHKGLTDADSIADWDPPAGVGINQRLVTKQDEEYWDRHRAAPKLFLNLATARRLWGNTYGNLNTVRVPAEKGEAFAAELLRRIDPATMSLAFRPIRQEQLAAASGPTDFAGLFVGFSFFIIVAAAMLLAMLFRLGIEQRSRQFGLLGSLGFTPRTLYRLSLVEGLLLAVLGGAAGVGLAIGYTALMIYGLRTWWVGAVGTTALRLHSDPRTLVIGFVASMVLAVLAITWAVWRLRRSESASLLSGSSAVSDSKRGTGRVGQVVGVVGFVAGLGLVVTGIAKPDLAQAMFLAGGGVLLFSSLTWTAGRFLLPHRNTVTALSGWSLQRLAFRNAGRSRARSVTTVALIAFASFVLVTVASMRQEPPRDTHDPKTGTGGYQLVVQSEAPLLGDLNTSEGRDLLGLRSPDATVFERTKFVPFRSWAGQDVSCLNITRPDSPTILAVPRSLADQNRFVFARTERQAANPWALLEGAAGDEVPVIADDETARYVLKLPLGGTITVKDQSGGARRLRLVATLGHSIFQGELLMSEANFLRLFPSQSGFGMVLVETPSELVAEVQKLLATELADFAVTVEPTAARLARYQEVANTYLSTFQTLGALGLMLGTVGLAVILLRGIVERRSELALLGAIGFRSAARVRVVLVENAYLLGLGLFIGAMCALIGVVPAITSGRNINLLRTGVTLLVVLVFGLVVLSVATRLATRRLTPAALRAE